MTKEQENSSALGSVSASGAYHVFISYSSADVAAAVKLQQALEERGLIVWRDKDRLKSADKAGPVISRELQNSAAVAVIWSDNAVRSDWVREEAAYAERAGKYLPLGLDGFRAGALNPAVRDDTFIPLEDTLADPSDFVRQIRALRDNTRAGDQIRHPEIHSVPGFTGRADMLAELETMLWQGKGSVAIRNSNQFTIAMHGLGGIGKTVLARHYGWDRRARYHGLWWIRAEQPETLMDDLAALGARLGLALKGMEPEDAALATIDRLAQHKTAKPWLLIYDNVEDKLLARRFTPLENAHILYTSRIANWFGEAEELQLGVFPREAAIDFLLVHDALGQDREAAGRLADALGRLPLALDHARAYCGSRGWSFDRYAERLSELLRQMPQDTASDYQNTVHATFSLAMERASEDCASAETLMGLIAHYAPEQIPLWLIPDDAMPEAERDEAIAALQRVSLVAHDPLTDGSSAISIHRLVQEVARARLREAGSAEACADQATQIIEHSYDDGHSHSAVHRNSGWLPHALAILAHAPQDGAPAWHTLWTCNQIGDFRITRGEMFRARESYELGLKIAKRLADASPDNVQWQRDLSVSHTKIGDVQRAQGNLTQALASFQASLDIRERLSKADPGNAQWQRDLATSDERLGDIHVRRNQTEDAIAAFERALTVYQRLIEKSPDDLPSRVNSVVPLWRLGELRGSVGRADLEAALAILKSLAETGRLDARRAGWIATIEAQMDALDNGGTAGLDNRQVASRERGGWLSWFRRRGA